jgi:hypothetical protein
MFMTNLNQLSEDVSLDGLYTLDRCIRQHRDGAFFAARTAEGERRLVKLVPDEEAVSRFATWVRARRMRHTNLLSVLEVRRCEVAGSNYICVVCEHPDDFLASGLEQRPLSEPEAGAVLEATLAALRYLHGRGLVHGAVDPDRIVAVRETVKLAPGDLRESNRTEDQAEDLRQLDELARRLGAPEPRCQPLAAVPRSVGYRALQSFPKWIVVAVAILLLSILIVNMRRTPRASRPDPAAPAAIAATPIAPITPSPVHASPPAAPAWRVIAYTYRSRDMAAKKAKQINARWPDLHAAVFEPKGGYYLVALGDRMSREDATRLQSKARGMGLPPDTYVQNYSE